MDRSQRDHNYGRGRGRPPTNNNTSQRDHNYGRGRGRSPTTYSQGAGGPLRTQNTSPRRRYEPGGPRSHPYSSVVRTTAHVVNALGHIDQNSVSASEITTLLVGAQQRNSGPNTNTLSCQFVAEHRNNNVVSEAHSQQVGQHIYRQVPASVEDSQQDVGQQWNGPRVRCNICDGTAWGQDDVQRDCGHYYNLRCNSICSRPHCTICSRSAANVQAYTPPAISAENLSYPPLSCSMCQDPVGHDYRVFNCGHIFHPWCIPTNYGVLHCPCGN